MVGSSAVEFKEAAKSIGGKNIIHGLTLRIHRGEVFGLLGPNGAGKTTTIRMMVGLISVSSGDILINGWSITHHFRKAVSQVGAIVENPEFYPFLSGYQNLAHYANMHFGVTRDRIEEVTAMVDLASRIHDPVRTYSLGMRQRLGVAQALLHQPSILILDEPTNGLDPAGIRELRQYIRYLSEHDGVTVIVSSHLLSEMEAVCDRVAFIKEGRLLDVKAVGTDERNHWMVFQLDSTSQADEVIRRTHPDIQVHITDEGIEVLADRERTAKITEELVKAGIGIYGIIPKVRTLEDLFMEVTE